MSFSLHANASVSRLAAFTEPQLENRAANFETVIRWRGAPSSPLLLSACDQLCGPKRRSICGWGAGGFLLFNACGLIRSVFRCKAVLSPRATAVVFGGQSCLAAGGSNIAAFVSGARCSPCDHSHHSHFLDRQPGGRPNGWVGGWEWFTGWEDVARLSLPFPCTLIHPLQDWDNWRRKSIDDWLHSQRSHWPSCNRRDNTATWGEAEGACLEGGGRLFVAAALSRTFYTEAHPLWTVQAETRTEPLHYTFWT